MEYTVLKQKAESLRLELINLVHSGKTGHIGGDLSVLNVLTVLYYHTLNVDPKNPKMPERDRFILSKGHCAEALYCVLCDKGFIGKEELEQYGKDYAHLGGHPDRTISGVELNTGALGHGLSAGVGMALSAKMQRASCYKEKLGLQAKFSVAVENWIEANDVQAVAIQCWDSLEQNYGCAPCVTMSMLSDKLIPAACETDLAGAVSMYALTLASGKASALLDWNNNFAEDRNKCVCTHCGNFPKSFVGNDDLKLGPLGVLGRTLGKINTFGAVYAKVSEGPFTYFRISTDDPKGCIKAYLGKGQITNDPYGMDGCIAVTQVDNLQKLMKYICKNGFEHHVAMCRTDVVDILNEAIETYLGWNLYVHE